MSSNRGVFRVQKRQLNGIADGTLRSLTPRVFNSDGLKTKECNGGFQPAGWKSKDGRLYFPTMKGLATVDPSMVRDDEPAPPVRVERVMADQQAFSPSNQIIVRPGKGQLEFQFTALTFLAPERIKFRYILESFDKAIR